MTGFWQVTLRCRDVEIDGVFYAKAKQFGIDITEVSLYEPPHDKINKMTARPDWADDLNLHWAHMPLCWFCHEAADMMLKQTDETISSKSHKHCCPPSTGPTGRAEAHHFDSW